MNEVITTARNDADYWDNGRKVSTDNAFRLGYVGKPHNFVADLERHGKARAASTKVRAKRVAAGTDRSAIAGLSKKADDMLSERRAAQILKPRAGGITLTNMATGRADAEKQDRTRRGGR
jgi:hypothetical protein